MVVCPYMGGASRGWDMYESECCGSSGSMCMPVKPGKPPELPAAATEALAREQRVLQRAYGLFETLCIVEQLLMPMYVPWT